MRTLVLLLVTLIAGCTERIIVESEPDPEPSQIAVTWNAVQNGTEPNFWTHQMTASHPLREPGDEWIYASTVYDSSLSVAYEKSGRSTAPELGLAYPWPNEYSISISYRYSIANESGYVYDTITGSYQPGGS